MDRKQTQAELMIVMGRVVALIEKRFPSLPTDDAFKIVALASAMLVTLDETIEQTRGLRQ